MTRKRNDSIILEYTDDGKGIEQKHLKDIFASFLLLHENLAKVDQALSIIYNLVTGKLKGKIKADSIEGEGTQFKIDIPINI